MCFCHASCRGVRGARFSVYYRERESDVILPCLLLHSQGGKIAGARQARRVACASAMPLVAKSGGQDSRCSTRKVCRATADATCFEEKFRSIRSIQPRRGSEQKYSRIRSIPKFRSIRNMRPWKWSDQKYSVLRSIPLLHACVPACCHADSMRTVIRRCFCHSAMPLVTESRGARVWARHRKGVSAVPLQCLLSRSQGGKILGVLQGTRIGCDSAMPLVAQSGGQLWERHRDGESDVLLPCLLSRSQGGKILGVWQGT